MDITGTQLIPAPRQHVWHMLQDPDVLKACVPGCERVERDGHNEFSVVMVAAVGPLKARFNGTLRLADLQPPASYSMRFEGQGGPVGFGKGRACVELLEAGRETELRYTCQAQVGGKLAQVGGRLIDNVARKLADDFFAAFRAQVAPGVQAEAVAEPAAQPRSAAAAADGGRSTIQLPRAAPAWLWWAAAALIGAAAFALR